MSGGERLERLCFHFIVGSVRCTFKYKATQCYGPCSQSYQRDPHENKHKNAPCYKKSPLPLKIKAKTHLFEVRVFWGVCYSGAASGG